MSRTTIRTQRLRRLVLLQVVVVLGLVPGVLGPVTALGAHAPRGQDRAGAFNSAITILAGGRTVEYARSRPHPAYAYDVVATPMTASTTLLVDAPHVDGSFDDFSERSPHTIKQILGDEEAAALDEGEAIAEEAPTVLRHYTDDYGARGIERDNLIRPSEDGNVYLTPDKYTNGPDAQAGLNLSKTPTGYFEVPLDRVPDAGAPTRVSGGTGTEVLNPGSVDTTGLTFNPF